MIELGATYSGRNLDGNDQDFFRIELPSEGDLSLRFTVGGPTYSSSLVFTVSLLNSDQVVVDQIESTTGTQEVLFARLPAGMAYVKIAAADYYTSETYQISASLTTTEPLPPNNPPALVAIEDKTVEEGQNISFVLSGSDSDGDALAYSVSGNPAGSSLTGNTFSWIPSSGQAGSYTLVFAVSDGKGGSTERSVTITVTAPTPPTPTNQNPTLTAIADKTIEENQTVSFVLAATDPDGDTLTYAVSGNPAGSALTGNSFSWVPSSGQAGSYTIAFTIDDGNGGSDTQSVNITVTAPTPPTPTNQPPTLTAISDKIIEEGQTVSFALSATDPDGDSLTYAISGSPTGATLSGDTFSWTPASGQAGSYAFFFSASDGNGGSDSKSVTVTVTAPTPSTPSNQPPTLTAIGDKSIEEGQIVSVVLSASDPDGDTVTYTVSGSPAGSTLTGNSFTWVPSSGQTGSYTPSFTASDGKGGTDSKSVTITVTTPTPPTPSNQSPTLVAISDKTVEEGQTVGFMLSASDPDGDTLTYSVSGNPTGSSLSGDTFTWIPSSGQAGSYTMTFTVSDGKGGTDSKSVGITVTTPTPPAPTNQPPALAAIDDKTLEEGQSVSFVLSGSDPDGDALTYSVSGNSAGSSLTGNTFSWTPTSGQSGSYTLVFTVSDGKGGSAERSVTITVNPHSYPPNIDVSPLALAFGDVEIGNQKTLEASVSNTGGRPATSSVHYISGSMGRRFSITPERTTVNGNETVSIQITFAPTGAGSAEAVLYVDFGAFGFFEIALDANAVAPNQNPTIASIGPRELEEDSPISFTISASDTDGDTLTLAMTDAPAGAQLADSVFSWTPTFEQAGTYQITFTASDRRGGEVSTVVEIVVQDKPNQNPTIASIGPQELGEDSPISFTISASDTDGDTLTLAMTDAPAGAQLADSVFSWTPTFEQAGTYQITFTASDGRDGETSTVVEIVVQDKNRTPVFADQDSILAREGEAVKVILVAEDPDGDSVAFKLEDEPVGASLSDGVFSWTPTFDQAGTYEIGFTAEDGQGGESSQVVLISVSNVNRSPTLTLVDEIVVTEGELLRLVLSAEDPDGDSVEFSVRDNPTGSELADSVFTWVPKYDQADAYTVFFTVVDDRGGRKSEVLIITVSDVEAPPPEPVSMSVSLVPVVPRPGDEVVLKIDGEFPASNASVVKQNVRTEGTTISIDLTAAWLQDKTEPVDDVVTPWSIEENIGNLDAGDYVIIVFCNGSEWMSRDFSVREGKVERGLVSLDFDLFPGDQGQLEARNAEPGKIYELELNIRDLRLDILGWSVSIEFDPSLIQYVEGSFNPSDYIPNIIPLVVSKSGSVEIGGTALESPVIGEGAGRIGTLQFEVLDAFAGSTDIIMTKNLIRYTGKTRDEFDVYVRVTISSNLALLGDFDDSGDVGFGDFFDFADAFGSDDRFYDLDGNGTVGFEDFFIFADNFGKEARAKLIALAREHIGLPMPGLGQNRPNPFNSETTIRYDVPVVNQMSLRIYDVTGQLVRELVHQEHPAGQYSVVWDGRNSEGTLVANGVYLYELRSDDFRAIRKMMLVK